MESTIGAAQAFPGLDILCDAIDVRQNKTTTESIEKGLCTIHIRFPKETHERLVINKRSNGKNFSLYIYVPSKLTGSKCQYIHFKNQYGTGMLFREFIINKLKQAVSTWDSHKDAEHWCVTHLANLKTQLESAWEYELEHLAQPPRKRQKSTADIQVSVRNARKPGTISIPLRGFVMKGEVPVIRIRQAKKRDRLFLQMSLPGVIFNDNKTRRVSLRARFGHNARWAQFVKKYMISMVSTWDTLDDIQKWFFDRTFVCRINRLWELRQ